MIQDETEQQYLFNISKSLSIKQYKTGVSFVRVRNTPNPDSFRHCLYCTAQPEPLTTCRENQCITLFFVSLNKQVSM